MEDARYLLVSCMCRFTNCGTWRARTAELFASTNMSDGVDKTLGNIWEVGTFICG